MQRPGSENSYSFIPLLAPYIFFLKDKATSVVSKRQDWKRGGGGEAARDIIDIFQKLF